MDSCDLAVDLDQSFDKKEEGQFFEMVSRNSHINKSIKIS